jgi:hypothetical protein
MTTSGQQANDDVTMTKKEHDELQGRLRKMEQADRDRKAKDARATADAEKKELEDRLKAAESAGIGKELREAEGENETLKAKLQKVLTDNAIRDAAGGREWTKSAQRAAVQMVDSSTLERDAEGVPTGDSIKTALDGLVDEYPDIYTATGGQSGDGDKGGKGKQKTVQTPANPGTGREGQGKFKGYISQEEYMETPFDVRQTSDFRQRLEKSRPYWPTEFNHKDL